MTLKECCNTKCYSFHKQVIECYFKFLEINERIIVMFTLKSINWKFLRS